MIDAENLVFDTVATALRTAYSGIYCAGEYVATPARFPAVTIVEIDNRVLQRMSTLELENAIESTFEINVYSNKTSGKKAEAKAVMDTADTLMKQIGFTRTFREQVPNLADATIYRITARYSGVITYDAETETFTVYQE